MKPRSIYFLLALLLLLLLHPHPSHAHNGAVAIAVPVEGITVDGDLSDWPEGMTRYPIELCEYGDKPVNEGDFKASFRIGYNSEENSLYIAVEVQDESTVIDTILQQAHWTKWWEIQDGCEVYVDLEHREIDSRSVQDVMYGNFPHVHGELEVRRVDPQHGYEWRIDIAEIMALPYVNISEDRKSLRAGMTLGFDVSVSDKDRDGSFSWMVWGKGSNKNNITSARGNIILSEKDEFSIYADYFLHNEIRCIAEDRLGTLWVGTYKGVTRYDGNQFSDFLSQEGLLDVPINSILEDRDGNLWFGTLGEGVSRYDGERLVTFPIRDNLEQNAVYSILQDRAGRLWFGTLGGGVSCYDGQTFTNFTADDGLVDERVWDMVQGQNGNIWFGTGGGVSCYDGQTFTNFTTDDGLVHNWVRSIIEDQDGNLWFGTRGGVSRYDGKTFVNFTMEDELAANYVVDILEDAKGQLWFGFNEARVNVYDGLVFQTLSKEHGIIADRILSLFQDNRSDIWIGTNNGLIRYRPYPAAPSILLTDVIADRRYGPVHQIAFPSSQKYLSFEFQGSSTKTFSDRIIYVYRLGGVNTEWQKTQANRVEYTDLPMGEYTFEVKAVDRDLSYSEEPATVKVIVHPPYSQIALWSGLGLSLIGLIIASGYGVKRQRERNRARRERDQAREQLVQHLEEQNQQIQEATRRKSDFLARMSHDLRTPMNAIIGYTRILLRRLRDTVEPRQLRNLENIDTSSHNLLNLINEILDLSRVEAGRIEVRPHPVDFQKLAVDCAATIEPLIQAEVKLVQDIEAVPSLHTDGEILRKVLMNLLGNAVKFTDAGSITVSVQPVEDQVKISVADTGMGIPAEDLPYIFEEFRQVERQGSTEKEGTGLGLAIAKKSVELLGGTLSAESEVGKGATFTLKIKDYPSE